MLTLGFISHRFDVRQRAVLAATSSRVVYHVDRVLLLAHFSLFLALRFECSLPS